MTQTIGRSPEELRLVPLHPLFGRTDMHRRAKVCCTFHGDKNPSMVIFPNGGYNCFACGAHGNSIDFCVKMGMTYQEALAELSKYG